MKSEKLKLKSSKAGPKKMAKKAQPKLVELTFTLKGINYRLDKSEISYLVRLIKEEEAIPCRLEPEPDNEADPKAVRVIALDNKNRVISGRHLGYIGRPANEGLFELLKRGSRVIVCLLDYVDASAGDGELQVALQKPER